MLKVADRFFYALLIAGVLFAFPAHGDLKSFQPTPKLDCITNFGRVDRAVEFARIGASTDLPPLDPRLSTLDPQLAKWIQIRNSPAWEESRVITTINFEQNPMLKVGEKVTIGTHDFEILARLGQGMAGSVYLVDTPNGIRAAKVFYTDRKFVDNHRAMRAETSMRTPKILSTDIQRKTMLLEHLAVVPIEEIETHSAALGITPPQVAEILSAWTRQKLRMKGSRSVEPQNFNVGYSFKDDEFQMFDPF